MNDREKLVDLMADIIDFVAWEHLEATADYLIANGVVVQEQGTWSLRCEQSVGTFFDVFYLECSECHRKVYLFDEEGVNWAQIEADYPYCHCGAYMKKGGVTMEEMLLQYDKKTGAWGIKKEPYITIEVETEEGFKELQEAIKKQKPMVVTEIEEKYPDGPFDYLFDFLCPSCQVWVIDNPYNPTYCKHCGQKLNWGEE